MRHLAWRGAPLLIAGIVVALGGAAVTGGTVLFETTGNDAGASRAFAAPAQPSAQAPATRTGSGAEIVMATQVAPLRRIVQPDLLAIVRQGITQPQLTRIARLARVRDMITADGGEIRLGTRLISVLGVDPSGFRSWTPPATAADEEVWAALARNELVLSTGAAAQLGLRKGSAYELAGATQQRVRLGASAALGVAGVNALVSRQTSRQLGLVPAVAVMINAPGTSISVLAAQVRGVLGKHSQLLDLRPSAQLPVDAAAGSGRPDSYLALYKASAARYCPGLSWTILAAIGQIESGHGANDGPSRAGALGPMQFLPSTWKTWGTPGFGDKTADIMNPYDAVPSAARYLCASGAAAGGASLYRAIFAYNHADSYVREVLALAQAYAQQFG